ncbi:MAG: hypothetical protein PWQ28_613 [Candidatus Woesearchaeota archaeon]|nr:hypothetical protein [Candidatus Woesearchaeota archaeon]
MATLLDLELFSIFSPIFVFIIVFLFMYIILSMVPPMKDKKSLSLVIAFLMAMIFSVYPGMSEFVYELTPGIVIFLIIISFVLITLSAVGLSQKDLLGLFGENNKGATWFFFIIALVIVGIAASTAFGEEMLAITDTSSSSNNASDEFQENIVETIFHPSVLGLIFFMLIAIFAMVFLTPSAKK